MGLFVLSYKSCYKILNYLFKENSWNHFISGFVFGSLIFGNKTGVNSQIVLYLFSRVVIGLATLIYKKISELGHSKWNFIEKGYGYYLLSAVVWGIVMWLFEK